MSRADRAWWGCVALAILSALLGDNQIAAAYVAASLVIAGLDPK